MQPRIYPPGEHSISQDLIDPDALYTLKTLREAGHEAYLVGGSVRDLLLGRTPKDFDISTSAEPEEIKQIFRRRCLLIGRRFRLAHVRFGSKILEVSTFRSGDINEGDLIVRDNEWGSAEEDAIRRDFTINALYYDAEKDSVIDYVGGFQDISLGLIRTIGNPTLRFRQDPVRMLRLLKFRARFGLSVDPEAEQAMEECVEEIVKCAPARILEEIFRMLESGASEPFFRLLTDFGFLDLLFPALADYFRGPHGGEVYHLLGVADEIIRKQEADLQRPVLAACLIHPILVRELELRHSKSEEAPHFGDVFTLTGDLIHSVVSSSFFQFPRRIRILLSFILNTQYRITPMGERKSRYHKLLNHRDFHLALQFLMLRAKVHPEIADTYLTVRRQYSRRSQSEEGNSAPPKRRRRRYTRSRPNRSQ